MRRASGKRSASSPRHNSSNRRNGGAPSPAELARREYPRCGIMRWLRRVRIEESRRLIRMTLNGRVRYAKKREEELRRSGLYKSLGWE